MVASKSGDAPHFAKTPPTLTGQFICDDWCLNYKTYKICSRTVVAAESNGKLRKFISWYKKNKSINLDALSKHGLGKELGKRVARLNHLGNVQSRTVPLQLSRLMA